MLSCQGEKIDKYKAEVYLINTGWIGGAYGKGHRINLSYTRAMVKAVELDKFKNIEFYEDPIFKVLIPSDCPDVAKEILNPRNAWVNKEAYDKKAYELAEKFENNFSRFKDIPRNIIKAGPHKLAIQQLSYSSN